jgi:hypothetical protein
MSPFARLRVVRAFLASGTTIRAFAWGIVTALTVLFAGAAVDSLNAIPLGARHALQAIAFAAGVATFGALLWRDRRVWTLRQVALWLEERDPSIAYTLVTAVETGDAGLVRARSESTWTRIARSGALRAPLVPVIATVSTLVALMMLPAGAVARIRSPKPGDSILGAASRDASRSRLSPLVARIAPPSYTRTPSSTVDDPTEIRPIAGSVVTFSGQGDARGIVAHVGAGADSLAASAAGDDWSVRVAVGARPTAVRFTDRSFDRLVVVNPVVDAPPIVELRSPAKDSVLRAPTGRVALTADATDDFGVASAVFEFIISSGEGETFKFRSGTIGAVAPNAKHTSLGATLSLDSLELVPGDIVHIRAVARDANTVSGPGVGTSETRALRVARSGEYDSLSVEAAAPTEETKNVVSQRMLIMLAEALQKRRPRLAHDSLVSESRSIAADQKRLRRTVGDVVFTRLGGDQSAEEHSDDESPARAKTMQELLARADSATNRSTDPIDFQGGESPVVAVNKPLLEAYNAMWDASTQLEIGEPGAALPHMRRALAAIEKARQAERLYLRGRPPQVVIDIDKARLKGKDKGSSATRLPLPAADSATRALESRLIRAIELSSRDAAAAIDSLSVLRIDALTDNATFAATLSPAIDAMRRGRGADATAALARARRSLAGPSIVRDSIARWGSVP